MVRSSQLVSESFVFGRGVVQLGVLLPGISLHARQLVVESLILLTRRC